MAFQPKSGYFTEQRLTLVSRNVTLASMGEMKEITHYTATPGSDNSYANAQVTADSLQPHCFLWIFCF